MLQIHTQGEVTERGTYSQKMKLILGLNFLKYSGYEENTKSEKIYIITKSVPLLIYITIMTSKLHQI